MKIKHLNYLSFYFQPRESSVGGFRAAGEPAGHVQEQAAGGAGVGPAVAGVGP